MRMRRFAVCLARVAALPGRQAHAVPRLAHLTAYTARQVPHIAAGDNLDLPLVGRLLRAAGAFFIRRAGGAGAGRAGGDGALYRRVLAGTRS